MTNYYTGPQWKHFADDNLNLVLMVFSVLDMVKKKSGKRRKCWLHFPKMFLKGFFLRVVKTQDCLGKG